MLVDNCLHSMHAWPAFNKYIRVWPCAVHRVNISFITFKSPVVMLVQVFLSSATGPYIFRTHYVNAPPPPVRYYTRTPESIGTWERCSDMTITKDKVNALPPDEFISMRFTINFFLVLVLNNLIQPPFGGRHFKWPVDLSTGVCSFGLHVLAFIASASKDL